jgi:CRISPR-associated protein Csm3
MKLKKIHLITAQIVCETGLHIGGSDAEIHIGGIDNQVVKNPITHEPYIPGSSLKGKIRSLLEWKSGVVQSGPFSWETFFKEPDEDRKKEILKILQLFGVGGSQILNVEQAKQIGPTRLSFWDCSLSRDWVEQIKRDNLLFVEAKTENTIDRIQGTAKHPRQTERVPAGALFDFNLSCKELDVDENWLPYIVRFLKLLELDSLGGSGSRGYGKIRFCNIRIDGQPMPKGLAEVNPFE